MTEEETRPELVRIITRSEATDHIIRPLFGPPVTVVGKEVLREASSLAATFANAREQAREIISAAHQEADQIRSQAREEGLEEAQREALETIARARAEYDLLVKAAETDLLDLSLLLASRLVGESIKLSPHLIQGIVSSALEHVRGRRQVTIRVHPDDLPVVESSRTTVQDGLEGARIYFEASPDVERGGCIIDTESGRIDASLKTQLKILRDHLLAGTS